MPDEFDGLLFEVIDTYKAAKLAAANDLRRQVAATRMLGDLLTRDMIDQGVRTLRSIDVRNQMPTFPPLFLTFLEHPEWIAPTDVALRRFRRALGNRKAVYDHFVSNGRAQPMPILFELNLFRVLDEAFTDVVPQPQIPGTAGTTRRADITLPLGGVQTFIEATVLGQGKYWTGVEETRREYGDRMYATSGPGPTADARRVVGKIADELKQTAPTAPNVIVMAFPEVFPSAPARQWAFDDVFSGGRHTAGFNLANISRVDSIYEFSRNRLVNVHVNPHCVAPHQLTPAAREQLRAALANSGFLMIR
jgi:hypothetical protein